MTVTPKNLHSQCRVTSELLKKLEIIQLQGHRCAYTAQFLYVKFSRRATEHFCLCVTEWQWNTMEVVLISHFQVPPLPIEISYKMTAAKNPTGVATFLYSYLSNHKLSYKTFNRHQTGCVIDFLWIWKLHLKSNNFVWTCFKSWGWF